MIIGKRQIIVAALVLILGMAVYLNWQFASKDEALTVADVLGVQTQTSSGPTYGQAEQVNAQPTNDYFAKARLDKQASRDQATDSINVLLAGDNITEAQRTDATNKAMQIAKMSDNEASIENQVKAKGFQECVAYVEDERVNVTVKSEDITSQQAAQIKDIIVGVTNISPSGIVITPVK